VEEDLFEDAAPLLVTGIAYGEHGESALSDHDRGGAQTQLQGMELAVRGRDETLAIERGMSRLAPENGLKGPAAAAGLGGTTTPGPFR